MMTRLTARTLLWAALGIVAGCPGQAGRGGASTTPLAARDARSTTTSHRGALPFASHYGERTSYELSSADQALMDAINRASVGLGRAPLSTDAQAHRAAAEICRGLPAQGPPPAALVDFALRAHGLIDPAPHLVVGGVSAGDEVSPALASRVETLLARRIYRRVGLARCPSARSVDVRRLVITLYESVVNIANTPRQMRLGAATQLRARVRATHREIAFVVADPSGSIHHPRLQEKRGSLVANIPCAARGVYRVEITGKGAYGAEVLANFPMYCDQSPPSSVSFRAGPPASYETRALEARLFSLTNAFRRGRGLASLRLDAKSAAVARRHCEDMRAQGFVGHRSPSTGLPGDRMRRGGVLALVVRENVARAYSVEEALDQLITSPAHLENLASTDVTHLGVGVVVDRRGSVPALLITQNFIRPAMRFRPQKAQAELLRMVQARREKAGLSALRHVRELGALARRYLVLERGEGRKVADAWLSGALRQLGGRYRQVGGLMLKARALEVIAEAGDWKRAGVRDIGMGFEERKGVIVLFALLAMPR